MIVLPYHDIWPKIAQGVFVAPNATIIGDVTIGHQSSIWFNAVLRGDVEAIIIGQRTNIQDGCIIHTSTNRCPTIIGNDVTVGHRAILHGCTIEDEVLIGMGAIVLDEAVVPRHTLVAAGALVPEKMVLESGWVYAGVPVKKVKPLTAAQVEGILLGARGYVGKGDGYLGSR
jgi:carbonic anhydrase/acetyltransferase-like protein (isoleucine patch superfamily)